MANARTEVVVTGQNVDPGGSDRPCAAFYVELLLCSNKVQCPHSRNRNVTAHKVMHSKSCSWERGGRRMINITIKLEQGAEREEMKQWSVVRKLQRGELEN